MQNGTQKLGYDPDIRMSSDDWENFCQHGLLLNEDDELDHQLFEMAMHFLLADYAQRLLANKMTQFVRTENESAPLVFAIKVAILDTKALADGGDSAWTAGLQELMATVAETDSRICGRRDVEAGKAASQPPPPTTPSRG